MRFVLVLLVAMFAGCASSPIGDVSVAAPEWAAGNSWTYTWEAKSDEVSDNGESHDTWFADEPIVQTVLREATLWDETGWLVHQEGEGMFQSNDGLHLVENETYLMRQITKPASSTCDAGTCTYKLNPSMSATSTPSGRYLDFPLTPGKNWTYALHGDRYYVEVMGIAYAETEAGRYEAVHIRQTGVPEPLSNAIQELKESGATVHRYDVDYDEEVDIYYSPDVGNVVRVERTIDVTFDVHVEWPHDDWTEKGTANLEVITELADFDLDQREAYTDDEILELLELEGNYLQGAIGVPAGIPMAENVSLEANIPESVNLADGPFDMSIDFTGDNGPYTHEWHFRDYNTWQTSQFASGTQTSYEPDDIGYFEFRIHTFDANGTYVHVHIAEVEAHWEGSFEGTCTAAVRQLDLGDCDEFDFPGSDEYVRMELSVQAPAGSLNDGRVAVFDGTGGYELAERDLQNGQATIDTEMWAPDGTWRVVVEPSTNHEEGPVSVDLRLSPAWQPYWH